MPRSSYSMWKNPDDILVDSSPTAERGSYYSTKTTELKSQYNLKVLW